MRTFEVFFGKPSFALIVGILFTLAVLAGIFLFLKVILEKMTNSLMNVKVVRWRDWNENSQMGKTNFRFTTNR